MRQFRFNQLSALALTVGMVASLATPAFAAAYRDTDWHWAKPDIEYLTAKHALVGYGDGTFRPNRYVTRAEFTSMLVKALEAEKSSGRNHEKSFSDVQSNWASDMIEKASAKELIEGYPDSSFRPDKPITRAEALAILSKVTLGPTPDQDKTALILKNYTDAGRIPAWARESVAKTIHNDVFKSVYQYQNSVRPYEAVTRGEVAHMLNNLLRHNEIASMPEIEVYHNWKVITNGPTVKTTPHIAQNKPSGTFTTTVATPISSEFTRVGDDVVVILDESVSLGNGSRVEAGSKLMGRVDELTQASNETEPTLQISFNRIVTPSGQTIPVNATVGSADGTLRRSSFKEGVLSTSQMPERSANKMLDNHFVRVGVGDHLEVRFN